MSLAYRELGFPNFQLYVEDRLGITPLWANYLVYMVRKAIKAVNLNTGSDSESYAIEMIAADYRAGIGLEQRVQTPA